MCIVCGVPLELATESPQAIQERNLIRHLIAQGLTKDQIEDRLVAEYGPNVLATPSDSGSTSPLGSSPARRSSSRRSRSRSACAAGAGGEATAPRTADGDSTLSDAEAERLDEDLARSGSSHACRVVPSVTAVAWVVDWPGGTCSRWPGGTPPWPGGTPPWPGGCRAERWCHPTGGWRRLGRPGWLGRGDGSPPPARSAAGRDRSCGLAGRASRAARAARAAGATRAARPARAARAARSTRAVGSDQSNRGVRRRSDWPGRN